MNTEINFQKECSNQCKKKKPKKKTKKTRGSANTFLVDKKSLLERKIHKIFKMINKGLYYSVCNHLQCQNFNETTKLISQI